jgi:hypothetical protein
MALQSFVVPWSLFQFLNLFYTDGRTPWTRDQPVARPLPAHRTTQHTDIHAFSGIRTHDLSLRANDRAATMLGGSYVHKEKRTGSLIRIRDQIIGMAEDGTRI